MKKTILLTALILMISVPAFATKRGPLPGVFASWYSVAGNADTVATFPFNSRDLTIHNGSAIDVCVSLKGETIGSDCVSTGDSTTPTVFQLDGAATIELRDYVTESVSFRSAGATASPITVISTY